MLRTKKFSARFFLPPFILCSFHSQVFSSCLLVFFFLPQRRLNVDCYNISPDLNFILLYECQHDSNDDSNGTKYFVYEIFSTNIYPLSPNGSEEVELQKILWSPGSYDSNIANGNNNINNDNNNNINSHKITKNVLPNANTVNSNNNPSKTKVKFEKSKLSQAIAFIHEFDIYYKPKIHSDLVIRITSNGKFLFHFSFR